MMCVRFVYLLLNLLDHMVQQCGLLSCVALVPGTLGHFVEFYI